MIESNRQEQSVSEGGVAIQAKGDVNFHTGVSVSDIRDLVDLILENKLPVLMGRARAEAERTARALVEELGSQLLTDNRIAEEEFNRADTQAAIGAAFSGAALKGDDADIALVARVLRERLASSQQPLLRLVSEQAIEVLPKLTSQHISYLALLQLTKHVKFSFGDVGSIEAVYKMVSRIVQPAFGITKANQQYLASMGLLTINSVADADNHASNLKLNYPFMPGTVEEIRNAGAESVANLIEECSKIKSQSSFLTAPGQLIGMQHLVPVIGQVPMSIWIN